MPPFRFAIIVSTMSYTVPSIEPAEIVSGDFLTWKISNSTYPANLYTLSYRLVGSAGVQTVTASADGNDHLVEVAGDSLVGPPAVVGTDAWVAGFYTWTKFATEIATSRRITLGTGKLTVLANPATQTATDTRTHARKVLDAIEAVLEGTASKEQSEQSIDGKALKRRSIEELLALRTYYKAEVAAEEAAAATANGATIGGRFLMRL